MSTPKTVLIGPPHLFATNVIYALPARACQLFATVTTGFEVNTVNSTTGMTALVLTDGQATVGPGFIRNTATTTTAFIKSF